MIFNTASQEDFKEVKDDVTELNSNLGNQLSYNGKTFYLDEKDGKLGCNTDPNRGADTFIPFHSGLELSDDTIVNNGNLEVGKKYLALLTDWDYAQNIVHITSGANVIYDHLISGYNDRYARGRITIFEATSTSIVVQGVYCATFAIWSLD